MGWGVPAVKKGDERRQRIIAYIEAFIAVHGYSPTFREIMDGSGTTPVSRVHYHLHVLRGSGRVTFDDKSSRTLRVVSV